MKSLFKKMNAFVLLGLLTCTMLLSLSSLAQAGPTAAELISGAPQVVPIPGRVTMLDLGAHKCIPCKMMAPVIKDLSAEYDGRAAIVFIDVWENREIPSLFNIRTIPTQIFYDVYGKEVYRHEGFMDKAAIVDILKKIGVK